MTKLALLADIHGNSHALAAVLAELERLQPDRVVINGDLINAVPDSNGVLEIIRKHDFVVTRGNHEFYYLNYGTPYDVPHSHDGERWGQLHWLVDNLQPEHGRYLAELPDDLLLAYPGCQSLRIAHGTPGHHRWGFYEDQPHDEVLEFIRPVNEATLVSAHTHVQIDWLVDSQRRRQTTTFTNPHDEVSPASLPARRWHIINPGSVGMPLNGDVRAQFAILESSADPALWGGWQATFHRVDYDRRPVLESYYSSGMLEQGGVISELFYWEIVTAEREISLFFYWAEQHLSLEQVGLRSAFEAYKAATGRQHYIRQRDPYLGG